MNKVAIITDSTANIPADHRKNYPIFSVPLGIIWDSKMFEDGVSITPIEFYERIKTSKDMPITSLPPAGKILALMNELIAHEYDILGIFISSQLSGTLHSAMQAQSLLPAGSSVKIMDSESTTLALGFQVMAAARAATQGATLDECIAIAENARRNTGVYFMVDTLEFLHRGGRIGGAQRFLGTALKMKPILYLHKGRIDSLERVRTKGKALERLVDLVEEKCAGKANIHLAGIHANAIDDAMFVLEKSTAQLHPVETLIAELSPVVGTHVGPGTVALAYMTGIQ